MDSAEDVEEVEAPQLARPAPKAYPEGFLDPGLPKGVFSNSQYKSYKSCAHRYELKYILKLAAPSGAALVRGSAVHKGIETALKAKMMGKPLPSLAEATAVVSDTFEKLAADVQTWDDGTEEGEPAENAKGKVKDRVIQMYDTFHRDMLPKLNPQGVEQEFSTKVGSVPMLGYIDLIDLVPAMDTKGLTPEQQAELPQKLVVSDVKTVQRAWTTAQLTTDTQLTLYSHVTGIPDVRVDQLVAGSRGVSYRPITAERTQQDAQVYVEDLEETADLIKKGVFPKAPIESWTCTKKACSYWNVCRGKNRP